MKTEKLRSIQYYIDDPVTIECLAYTLVTL